MAETANNGSLLQASPRAKAGSVPDTEQVPPEPLDPLARRIVGALQVDGRASWRRIADVLGEPERTVSRRGTALLDDGSIRVVGLTAVDPSHVLTLTCRPGTVRSVAAEVAQWPHSVFVYALADSGQVVAELTLPLGDLSAFVLDELPRLTGVRDYRVSPVLQYFRTVAEWRPGLLTPDEVAALEIPDVPPEQYRPGEVLDDVDRSIITALVADGRIPFDAVGSLTGFSEATARRRIDLLVQRGVVRIRAVVEPTLLGLPIEAMLWVRCAPDHVLDIGRSLVASPHVRYAAYLGGEPDLLVDATVPDLGALRDLLTDPTLLGGVETIRPTLVLEAFKRGGVQM